MTVLNGEIVARDGRVAPGRHGRALEVEAP
jgi:hypothetical protein